jgi:hypothetical protein
MFLFVALLTVMPTFAQSDDGDDDFGITTRVKKNQFFIGPKAGATFTTMTDPDECKLYDSFGTGFSAGLALKARFGQSSEYSPAGTGHWGVGLELKYMRNTVATVGIDESGKANADLSVDYFAVPVYLQFYPLIRANGTNTFYIELGASFGGTLSRSPESLTVNNPSVEYSQITYNLDTDGSTLKGMDVRPLVGIGYTIPGTSIDLNGRYYIGTTELAGNIPCKMSSAEISISWLINTKKMRF